MGSAIVLAASNISYAPDRLVRLNAHPSLGGVLGGIRCRLVPLVDLAIGIREPDRPEERDALPGDGGVQHHHHEFARELARNGRRQQKCFAIFLEQDHRKRRTIFFARMDANKTLAGRVFAPALLLIAS